MEHIRLSTTLLATPEEVYDAWISSLGHTAMTGSAATSEPSVGGAHTAWDGYISGKHLELEPGKRIVQTWRTTEFGEHDPDSVLEVLIVSVPDGTRLTLMHSGIPDGQGEMYSEGWQDRYFAPMSQHFVTAPPKVESKAPPAETPVAKRSPTVKKPATKAAPKKSAKKAVKRPGAQAPGKGVSPRAKAKKPARKATAKAAKTKAKKSRARRGS